MARESQWLGRICRVIVAVAALNVATMSEVQAATGRTTGQFNVTPGGSATYSIPIFAPPGPRGMQPNLALVYSSSGGSGYLGRGWSLAGISAITRCQRSLQQDGEGYLTQSYASDDAYCLDGNRLRLQDGYYGWDGSAYGTEIADYSRIELDANAYGPLSWTVKRKDGTIYTYGAANNSCVLPEEYSGVCRYWLVNEIRDRAGNKIIFHYSAHDSTNIGLTHPTKIEWTRTSSSSSSYVYSMEFEYSSDGNAPASSPNGHTQGTRWHDNDLLTSISVMNLTTTVRKYVLTYETASATGVKRLTTVKECSDANEANCLGPTTIEYQNGAIGVSASASFTQSTAVTQPNGINDYDGNGCRDLTYRRSGAWYVRMANCSGGYGSEIATGVSDLTLMTGDPFGSGRDYLLGRSGSSPYNWLLYRWNGSGFTTEDTGVADGSVVSLQDANGDGKDDMVYWIPAYYSGGYLEVRYSASTGTTPSFGSAATHYYDNIDLDSGDPDWFIYYADLAPRPRGINSTGTGSWALEDPDRDGDGRPDLILDGEVTWCHWGPPTDCVSAYYSALVGMGGTAGYSQVGYGAVSSETMYVNPEDCDPSSPWWAPTCRGGGYPINTAGVGSVVGVIDWNHDGRPDILEYLSGSTLSVQLATGEGLASAQSTNIGCIYFEEGVWNQIFLTDADGDGLFDVGCLYLNGSLSVQLHNGALQQPDLATSFTDGFGVNHSVSYVSSVHDGYTATAATYPLLDVTRPQTLVRSVTASDGIGGTYTTTYSYFGAKSHATRQQYLGFEKIEVVDSRIPPGTGFSGGLKQVQKFSQTFPYVGMLIESSANQPDSGPEISTRVVTPDKVDVVTTAHQEQYFPFAASTVADVYEVGGSRNGDLITRTTVTLSASNIDEYGNPELSTTVVTDMDENSDLYGQYWTTTTTQAFSSSSGRTNYWCVGLPDSITVNQHSSVSGEASVSRVEGFAPDFENCRINSETVGSGAYRVATDYTYGDSFGNVTAIAITGRNTTDTGNLPTRITSFNFGTTGQFPVSETNALSKTTTRTFDSTFGSLLTETDPNSITVVTNEYDSFGRLTRSIRPDGTATAVEYAACATYGCQNGDPASSTTGINKTIVITSERIQSNNNLIRDDWVYLDQFDRPIVEKSMTDTGGYSRTGTQYDALGRVYRQTMPCDASSCTAFWVVNTYDVAGRRLTVSHPESQSSSTPVTATIAYGGRAQTVTNARGKIATKITDVLGRMRSTEDDDGYKVTFKYDAAGSLLKVTDSASNDLFKDASYAYGVRPFLTASTDMDLGAWTYSYNSLGELVSWTDAKSQTFSQTFDALSRVLTRTEPDMTTCWEWGNSDSSKNIGRLAGVWTTDNNACSSGILYSESLAYDGVGRLGTRTITTDQSYDIDYTYTNGRLDTIEYPTSPTSSSPSRLKVKYGYDYGILKSVRDWTGGSGGTTYWTANARSLLGQVTQETLGNNVITNRSFDAVTGRLNYIQSGPSGTPTSLQNLSYAYDEVGNVKQRQESTAGGGLTENFCYDDLSRLSKVKLGGSNCDSAPKEFAYNAMGNITSHPDVSGSWTYDSTKKHAVTSIGSIASFSYDSNGNMTNRTIGGVATTIEWSSYNYPTEISNSSESAEFKYGPNREYYKQVYNGPSSAYEETHYVGGILEKVYNGTSTNWRHYILAEDQVVAIVSRSTSGQVVYYPLGDNQSSGSVHTSDNGAELVRQSYEPFGLPRDGSDWDGAVPTGDQTIINGISRRGYTGHSMLGAMGLIHMNGRVQDAITGRFLSPDPYVQYPGFTQSFNRYSYLNNNPLSFVDPSGFMQSCPGKPPCLDELQDAHVTALRPRFDFSVPCATWRVPVNINGIDDCVDRDDLLKPGAFDRDDWERYFIYYGVTGAPKVKPKPPALKRKAGPQGNQVEQCRMEEEDHDTWAFTMGGYARWGFELQFGEDEGNNFVTLRVGAGKGGGVSLTPYASIPGPEIEDRSKSGFVLSASAQAKYAIGPISGKLEGGYGWNVGEGNTGFYGGPNVSYKFPSTIGWSKPTGSVALQATYYVGRTSYYANKGTCRLGTRPTYGGEGK